MPLHPLPYTLDSLPTGQCRRVLLLIIGLGFLVRVGFLYATQNTGLRIVDEQHYYALALNLLHGEGLAWEPGRLTSARPPLYPAFIAMVWKISGTESVLPVRIAQILLALVNVYLLYRLGLLLFDWRTAVLAAAGLCFYPSLLAFNFLLLTEVLFTFLLTLVILAAVVLLRTGSLWVAWGTGLVLGLASLTRSVLWPFPAVLLPLVFAVGPGTRKRRLWVCWVLFVGYALLVVPWAARNTKLQGVLTMVDTMGGITLRMGNYEHTPFNRAWDPVTLGGAESILQDLPLEHPDASSWTEGQKEKWALKKALIYMLEHPGVTFQRGIIKFANFWGLERTIIAGWQQGLYKPPQWFEAVGTLIIPLFYIVVMLLACLGIFRAAPKDYRSHVMLLLVIGFVAGMHTLTFGHERYHLPLIPFLLLYAASAVVRRSWRDIRLPVRSSVAPLTVSACLLVIWAREVLIVDSDRIQILLRKIFG